MCSLVTMETVPVAKHACNYVCDVTNGASMEIKILSKIPGENQPAICDVKVN